MGRQYVRQSLSSASCAAGESPCACNTIVQWVVANATAPFCALELIALDEVASSLAGTLQSK